MSEASNAVFLSYASQDAAAVLRIAEALRAAGVEVWFDKNELVGGDAWDAKIRGQIASCALFVPVISAATQARGEGYFRLEWKLAVDRSHLMAHDQPFLLPVVIDGTTDAAARVPPEFRAVQWTRLRPVGFGGEARDEASVAAFCARVGKLLDGSVVARVSQPVRAEETGWKARATSEQGGRRVPAAAWAVAVIMAALAGGGYLWLRRPLEPTLMVDAAARPRAAEARAVPLSPARELVEKARLLYEPWDLATKDDLVMAESFLKRAAVLDPTDGEVWAAQALVSCAFVAMTVTTDERRVEMRTQAERAVKLAPDSDNARFARAFAIRLEGKAESREEAMPILREVLSRNPTNRLMLRGVGYPLTFRVETRDEGIALLRRAAELPGGDAVAEFNLGQVYMYGGGGGRTRNLPEALAAFNRSLKLAPRAHRTHSSKVELLLRFAGDLAAARQALRDVPTVALREDRMAVIAVRVLLATGEHDEALRILGSTYPYLNASMFTGPTPYLKALVHLRANRLAAAANEWTAALREIEQRLTDNPTVRHELVLKAATLAYLGRQSEALATLKLYQELVPSSGWNMERVLIVQALLGRRAEVVATLNDYLTRRQYGAASFVLFEPELAPLRSHPDFVALADKARAATANESLK